MYIGISHTVFNLEDSELGTHYIRYKPGSSFQSCYMTKSVFSIYSNSDIADGGRRGHSLIRDEET